MITGGPAARRTLLSTRVRVTAGHTPNGRIRSVKHVLTMVRSDASRVLPTRAADRKQGTYSRSMKYVRLALYAAVGLVVLQPVRSQDLTGFNALRIEPSARASALGGSLSAVYDDDVNTFLYNPALLNEGMDRDLSVSYLNHVSDISVGSVAYGRHFERYGTFAAGLRYLHWGTLQGGDEDGQRTGTFGASDLALTLGGARHVSEGLRYGAGLHIVYSGVETHSASAVALDAGILWRVPLQRLSVSASVHNLGFALRSLGPTRDALPVDIRIGVSKRLRYIPFMLSLTGYSLESTLNGLQGASVADKVFRHLLIGGEFQLSRSFNLRFGYSHRRHRALKRTGSRLDLAGVGMGFGLAIRRFRLDYAFNSWSFAGLHHVTVRTKL